MPSEAFMHVRNALGAIDNGTVTDANATGLPNLSTGTYGGVETQKIIDRMLIDAFSRDTEFRQLVRRESLPPGTISFSWLMVGDPGLSKVAFYSDGGSGTPDPSNRKQAITVAKALRSDYEVSGLMIAGGFFDVLEAEARDAITEMNLIEERAFIKGNDTASGSGSQGTGGVTGAYEGLQQLMLENSAHGVTNTIYGLVQGTDAELDLQTQDAGVSGTATGVLDLADLDAIKTAVEKRKLTGRRIWLMSFERADELQQLLQPQQRFMGSIEQAGGFRIPTYSGIPVVRSKVMANVGVLNTSSASNDANTDNVIYLLDLDDIVFKTVSGVDQRHVPILGGGDSTNYLQRGDVRGGYYKTYGVFVMKRFDSQGIIWNLTAP